MRLSMEFTQGKLNASFHFMLRDEIRLFYAQHLYHLGTVVVAKNGERGLAALDPQQELSRATGPMGKEKIRNTARVYADHILVPMHEKWYSRTQALIELQSKPAILPPRSIWTPDKGRQTRTRRNHYIPRFSTKHWANSRNEVMVFSRGLDGSVKAEPQRVASWAAELNLYPQHIEDYFSSVEKHAAGVYRKLLTGQALAGPDRQNWIIFLICQIFRAPRHISSTLLFLRKMSKDKDWPYPTTPEALVKAWEYNFADEGPALSFYPYFDKKKWLVLEAHGDDSFIQTDEGLLVVGPLKDESSIVFFPLSPRKCFVAGPFEEWLLSVKHERLSPGEATHISGLLAANAHKTVISRTDDDSEVLRNLLGHTLASKEYVHAEVIDPSCKYWGSL